LIAIDARTGRQQWSAVTVDQRKNYTITGAPRVVKGRVIIGNGGAEYGVRGYVSAYDAKSGSLLWRFYTVPGQLGHPDHAASDKILHKLADKTWSRDTWSLTHGGGGGTVWDSMAYDPESDLLYVGVGNGAYWPRKFRSPTAPKGGNNDNLFLASIVALRPETGEYVWHYQVTPGDQWDYDSTQHMVLADLVVDDRLRKVLMQASKNGYFYVVDRLTGGLLSATPFAKLNWSTGIDLKTGRPNFNPEADYSRTGKLWLGTPGPQGAHGWPPMSFNPKTGLVYIPTQENSFPYILDPAFEPLPKGYDLGVNIAASTLPVNPKSLADIRKSFKGYITAWDPIAQHAVWHVPQPTGANGGMLSTAGNLLFEGGSTGLFVAYDTSDGHTLWSFDAQSGIIAAPVSWAKEGRQFVTVLAGWGSTEGLGVGPINWSDKGPRRNISRVLTFTLDGAAKLPPVPVPPERKLQLVPQFADAAKIEEGRRLYHRSCYGCHGPSAMSGGVLPDLRYSAAIADQTIWNSVLVDGLLTRNGMVSFKDNYTLEQLDSIRAYVIGQAHASAEVGGQ
jgi:alcohol dehydrogenase (cytochrome c)/quinohemoprotein ethanol dehydrogenase